MLDKDVDGGMDATTDTNKTDFPIRQLQVRVSLPTEEEPPKDRMDPGLQEVRVSMGDMDF